MFTIRKIIKSFTQIKKNPNLMELLPISRVLNNITLIIFYSSGTCFAEYFLRVFVQTQCDFRLLFNACA